MFRIWSLSFKFQKFPSRRPDPIIFEKIFSKNNFGKFSKKRISLKKKDKYHQYSASGSQKPTHVDEKSDYILRISGAPRPYAISASAPSRFWLPEFLRDARAGSARTGERVCGLERYCPWAPKSYLSRLQRAI